MSAGWRRRARRRLDGADHRRDRAGMSLVRSRPYGPISDVRLRTFEESLPATLPADYRVFLVDHNGAEFDEGEGDFVDVDGGTNLRTLFGLHDGPGYERLDAMRGNFPTLSPSMLVIGADAYGNYFGMEIHGRERGAIFFIDHETLMQSSPPREEVASSFTALLERVGMEPVERPVVGSPREAISERDVQALRRLYENGASGEGLVHDAVHSNDPEIVRLTLAHGGDPNERGGIGGETPLFVAARINHPEITSLLLRGGADPNATCRAGGVALEMAEPWPKVFELLVLAGARSTRPRLAAMVRRILGVG